MTCSFDVIGILTYPFSAIKAPFLANASYVLRHLRTQPIHIPIEHAEHCCNQHGIMQIHITSSLPFRTHCLTANVLPAHQERAYSLGFLGAEEGRQGMRAGNIHRAGIQPELSFPVCWGVRRCEAYLVSRTKLDASGRAVAFKELLVSK